MKRPRRAAVRLTGTRRRAHLVFQTAGALAAAAAVVAIFLPWHDVRESHWGEAVACAFIPDCRPAPSSPELRVSGPPDFVDTGLAHGGGWILGLLALLLAARAWSARRPRTWLSVAVGLASLGAATSLLYANLIPHLFDQVTDRAGAALCDVAILLLAAAGLVDLLGAVILALAQRAADAGDQVRSSGSATST